MSSKAGYESMSDNTSRLDLIITASFSGAVGFGEVFNCEIQNVLAGVIHEPNIRLSILAGDKDKLSFILTHLHPVKIQIGFVFHRKNEPYAISPISGFVDKSQTSWVIDFIGEVRQ
jgi:hypothetical protein